MLKLLDNSKLPSLMVNDMSSNSNANFSPYPKVSEDYSVRTLSIIKSDMASRCYNLCVGDEALFFSRDECVWKVHPSGIIEEYARMKDGSLIAGIAFDQNNALFVLTATGVLIQIDENKKGHTVVSLSTVLDVEHPIQICDLSYASGVLCASVQFRNGSGILRLAPTGSVMWISRTTKCGTLGIFVEKDKFVWSVELENNSIVKRKPTPNASPLVEINIDGLNLNMDDVREGRICKDLNQELYVSAKDTVFRLSEKEPTMVEPIATGINTVTGLCFWKKSLYILESGTARILEVSEINCA